MAFRPGMTHAIPTCCQVASRTTSGRGVYCRYLHPTISTWLGWARSGHGVPPGDDSRYPHLLSAAAAEENPAYPLRCLLGQKCDWCQLRPRLCKWGPWIQRNMKSHSASALVGALICRAVAIADPPVLKHWVCTSAVPLEAKLDDHWSSCTFMVHESGSEEGLSVLPGV